MQTVLATYRDEKTPVTIILSLAAEVKAVEGIITAVDPTLVVVEGAAKTHHINPAFIAEFYVTPERKGLKATSAANRTIPRRIR